MRQKNLLNHLTAALIIHIGNLDIVVIASNMDAVILMGAAGPIANQADRDLIIHGHI